MVATLDPREFRGRLQRLEALLGDLERLPDAGARAHAREAVQAVLELHGAGLARVLEHLADAGEAGASILGACARDEVVGGLLLLHDLHPLDLEARVHQALDLVRPRLHAHHGDVELLGLSDGVVRLRLLGSCHGCPSSSLTMRQLIEEAILEKAPDTIAIEVEGVVEDSPTTPDGRPLVVLS